MAACGREEGKAGAAGCVDLYAVLGVKKECSAADLRRTYKKLALRWHPDRCSAAGSSNATEEAKTKFQAIQEAYSVLSDSNKRFLYDVGVYDSDDADGMSEFLGEMAAMMNQSRSREGGNESLEQLQELFVEMFQADMDAGGGVAPTASSHAQRVTYGCDRPSTSSTRFATTSYSFCNGKGGGGGDKRDSEEMQTGKAKAEAAWDVAAGLGPGGFFCFRAHDKGGSAAAAAAAAARGRARGGGKRRNRGRPKSSSRPGYSSQDGDTPAA